LIIFLGVFFYGGSCKPIPPEDTGGNNNNNNNNNNSYTPEYESVFTNKLVLGKISQGDSFSFYSFWRGGASGLTNLKTIIPSADSGCGYFSGTMFLYYLHNMFEQFAINHENQIITAIYQWQKDDRKVKVPDPKIYFCHPFEGEDEKYTGKVEDDYSNALYTSSGTCHYPNLKIIDKRTFSNNEAVGYVELNFSNLNLSSGDRLWFYNKLNKSSGITYYDSNNNPIPVYKDPNTPADTQVYVTSASLNGKTSFNVRIQEDYITLNYQCSNSRSSLPFEMRVKYQKRTINEYNENPYDGGIDVSDLCFGMGNYIKSQSLGAKIESGFLFHDGMAFAERTNKVLEFLSKSLSLWNPSSCTQTPVRSLCINIPMIIGISQWRDDEQSIAGAHAVVGYGVKRDKKNPYNDQYITGLYIADPYNGSITNNHMPSEGDGSAESIDSAFRLFYLDKDSLRFYAPFAYVTVKKVLDIR